MFLNEESRTRVKNCGRWWKIKVVGAIRRKNRGRKWREARAQKNLSWLATRTEKP